MNETIELVLFILWIAFVCIWSVFTCIDIYNSSKFLKQLDELENRINELNQCHITTIRDCTTPRLNYSKLNDASIIDYLVSYIKNQFGFKVKIRLEEVYDPITMETKHTIICKIPDNHYDGQTKYNIEKYLEFVIKNEFDSNWKYTVIG